MNIGFVGLGVMGFPMAGHLSRAGHQVHVYNRTESRSKEWASLYDGKTYSNLKTLAGNCEVVCVCVGNDDDVRSVVYGDEGILAGMTPESILIDHTTASAVLARELFNACKNISVGFLDAPVSGGQAGAENAALTIMVGGNKDTFDSCAPVFSAYAKCWQLIGQSGAGQTAKMMNQICIAGVVQGLAEALHFGQQAGIDCEAVIDVISHGAAQSWQMENRAKTMLKGEYDFGFAVDWMRKDLAIALDEARKNGSTLALTALVDQYYADVQRSGGNRYDTSSLLTRLNKNS